MQTINVQPKATELALSSVCDSSHPMASTNARDTAGTRSPPPTASILFIAPGLRPIKQSGPKESYHFLTYLQIVRLLWHKQQPVESDGNRERFGNKAVFKKMGYWAASYTHTFGPRKKLWDAGIFFHIGLIGPKNQIFHIASFFFRPKFWRSWDRPRTGSTITTTTL